ncbi:cytidine deaminase family protein [Streptomyces mirabilis]|uniref:cytidine deaminase family protein n=1 Tax=Streptomyces mirabilis TaxID=68239 RepID=UPI0033BE6765
MPTPSVQDKLASQAWHSKRNALIYGTTTVGCAVMDESGRIYSGCNVEHRFRSHDIHAETNALGSMVTGGGKVAVALFVVSPRGWAPCGSCLDWIFELGGEDCAIFTQSEIDGPVATYRAADLLPYFPEHTKPRRTIS